MARLAQDISYGHGCNVIIVEYLLGNFSLALCYIITDLIYSWRRTLPTYVRTSVRSCAEVDLLGSLTYSSQTARSTAGINI